ncbi:MAG: type II toxin-antitoxin system mRNA interferase toxin, RelE/StbE family [Candidatus Nealsonbacteria bacterium CG09_land_8_20_14_0_10_42_14]|uniref:Type II toxin-antitoxin system mRNA interferase toxin, RelE/StbE family n=1 Tax=Candidatus Nealsonbacteria bacterium CG09_land_8_20_14_0_10_42_14 TaxID=1974707 RepID=A0A2H0WX27_9BACT|nr:MAG: type II toxin-antitoxin system mRNA interferase toxin, RelE/StbE family [Candidatus Nealsonbacteria bacterium CG09_land_8_20_14_0_10_42_14]
MRILYSPEFARRYRKLPLEVQRKAEEKEIIFRNNPFDSRLRTHKLRGNISDFWAFYLDRRYRIIFAFIEKGAVKFYAIGGHSIYKKL